jgi:hypothetical protein
MSKKLEDWQLQARVDLFTVQDIQYEVEKIAARISTAIDEDDREAYEHAVAEWLGLEV